MESIRALLIALVALSVAGPALGAPGTCKCACCAEQVNTATNQCNDGSAPNQNGLCSCTSPLDEFQDDCDASCGLSCSLTNIAAGCGGAGVAAGCDGADGCWELLLPLDAGALGVR